MSKCLSSWFYLLNFSGGEEDCIGQQLQLLVTASFMNSSPVEYNHLKVLK